jgi:hypothetical protein
MGKFNNSFFLCVFNVSKSVCCWVRTGRGDNNNNVTKKKIRFLRERESNTLYMATRERVWSTEMVKE